MNRTAAEALAIQVKALTRIGAPRDEPVLDVEVQWHCWYTEFNDPACHSEHPDPQPADTRLPRKHMQCTWAVLIT